MKRLLTLTLGLAMATFLTACGGGGGGGSGGPVTSNETFQTRAAYVNFVTNTSSHPFNVSGTSSGTAFSGSGTLTYGSKSAATFENRSALQKTTTLSASVTANNTSIPISASSISYVDSNYNLLGFSNDDYAVVRGVANIPTTAKIGDTGIWYVADRYSNSSKTVSRGTRTVSYVLEAETASTALLKFISTDRNTSGNTTFNDTIVFSITPSGALTWKSEAAIDFSTSTTQNFTYLQ